VGGLETVKNQARVFMNPIVRLFNCTTFALRLGRVAKTRAVLELRFKGFRVLRQLGI
jgi:hypothetical protein